MRLIPLLLVVACLPALARSQTMPGDSAGGAPEPRGLFLDTIHPLQTARTLDIQLEQHHRVEPVTVLTDPQQQRAAAKADDAVEELRIARPGQLRFDHEQMMIPEVHWGGLHNVIVAPHLWVPRKPRKPGGPEGRVFDVGDRTVDELLSLNELMLWAYDGDLMRIADPQSTEDFFQYASKWKSEGTASDQGISVWRVGFDSPEDPPKHWEVWISDAVPHRITRMIVTGEETSSLTIVHAGYEHDPDGWSDPNKATTYTFDVHDRAELVFTKWSIDAPVAADTFTPPGGVFTNAKLSETPPAFKIGEEVPLPDTVSLADGSAVDLTGQHGILVLDFWFAGCGPCVAYSPKVEAVVAPFLSKGVRLYGVNPVDSGKVLASALTRAPWKNLPTIKDEHSGLAGLLTVHAYPTVVVLDANGRILFQDSPIAPAGLQRLRAVLEKATQ